MNVQVIDNLKRAYAEAMYESKRHDQAAEAIAVAIRCLSGGKVAPPVAAKPEPVAPAVDPVIAKAKAADRKVKREAKKAIKTAAKGSGMGGLCVVCGASYEKNHPTQKACSPACVKEKNRRYALAKYHTNVNIRKGVAAAIKPPAKRDEKSFVAVVGSERVCAACGKKFTPHRKDQKCCSTKCGRSHKTPNAIKPPVVANKAPVSDSAPVSRLDRIKAATARLDGMPQSVLDAAREAAESEATR